MKKKSPRFIDFLRKRGYSNDEIFSRLKSNYERMKMRKSKRR